MTSTGGVDGLRESPTGKGQAPDPIANGDGSFTIIDHEANRSKKVSIEQGIKHKQSNNCGQAFRGNFTG